VAGAAGDVAVEGRNALLVDPGSVEQVASALRRLVGDPALRVRMGGASRSIDASLDGRDTAAFEAAIAGERVRVRGR
jgi:hypothetical protein